MTGRFELLDNAGVGAFPVFLGASIRAHDLDNDQDADLVVANGRSNSISVLQNNLLPSAQRIVLEDGEEVVAADFGVMSNPTP